MNHERIVPARKRTTYYAGIVRATLDRKLTLPERTAKDGGRTGLNACVHGFEDWAYCAVDHGLLPEAQQWFAEAAACYLDILLRTGKAVGYLALRAFLRGGICHDPEMLLTLADAYLRTPHGSDRNLASASPYSHYWHGAHVLGLYYTKDEERLRWTLKDFESLRISDGWTHSQAWVEAQRAVAREALTAKRLSLSPLLANMAEVSGRMFGRDWTSLQMEAWFAEIAMAFVPVALDRGWALPAENPHPSVRLDLFRLPPRKVVVRPWDELGDLRPSEELEAAIRAAGQPAKKKATKRKSTAKKRPAKPAAKK